MARTDTATRVIGASPADVYTAMVDAAALAEWLPPGNMTAHFERFDPRPGGSYRLVLTYTDGAGSFGKASENTDIVEARFVDLVPEERVVQAVDFESDDPAFYGTMTMTWQIAPDGGGTRVDFIAEDVPEGISPEDHADGMAASLTNLARYLETSTNGWLPGPGSTYRARRTTPRGSARCTPNGASGRGAAADHRRLDSGG